MFESLEMSASRPPTSGAVTAKYAAAITADILMKNWIMSMTSTPQSPECAANTTLRRPTPTSVCQRSSPNKTLAILTAARLTVAMIMQLNSRPR